MTANSSVLLNSPVVAAAEPTIGETGDHYYQGLENSTATALLLLSYSQSLYVAVFRRPPTGVLDFRTNNVDVTLRHLNFVGLDEEGSLKGQLLWKKLFRHAENHPV